MTAASPLAPASQPHAPQPPAVPAQPATPATFNNSLLIDGSGYVSVTHNSALQPTVAATFASVSHPCGRDARGLDDQVTAVFRSVRDDMLRRVPALLKEYENL